MHRCLNVSCLLLAWLCANGAALDFMQVVAWGRMFADYARVMPVEAALTRTFDPSKPCPLCQAVRRARKAGDDRGPASTPAPSFKLVLIAQAAEPVTPPAIPGLRLEALSVRAAVRTDPVPVPPPRGSVARFPG